MDNEQLGNVVVEPFQVSSRWSSAGVAVVVGGVLLVGAGVLMVWVGPDVRDLVTVGMGVGIVGLAVLATGIHVLRSRHGRWRVAVYENGAEVQRKGRGKGTVLFADLAAIAHQPKPSYSNGEYAGIQHLVRFWRKDDPPKLPFVEVDCYIKAKKDKGEGEGMQALVSLAGDAICDRLTAVVADGGTVKSPCGLQVNANGVRYQGTSIALAEIADIGIYDGMFCIWKKGDEFASLRLDPFQANVFPMMSLVQRMREKLEQEQEQESEARAGDLGRVLFERRQSKALGYALLVVAVPLCLVLVGIPLFLLARGLIRGYFRCHERGVSRRFSGKETRLLYTQVAAFTYSATRMYYNGAYTGTNLVMNFQTDDPKALPPIRFTTTVRNVDEDLDELREHISAVVAQRLLQQYAEKGSFGWTKSLEVTTEGIRYRVGKLLGKGEWTVLPYENYHGISIQEGHFHLFAKDADKSVFHCAVSEPNFFPGLVALATLTSSGEEDGESSEEAAPEPPEEPTL